MKINKLIPIILCLATFLAVFSACSKKSEDYEIPDGYVLASAEEAQYRLFVPQTWTVDMKTTATAAYVSPTDPASVNVMTWTLSHTDSPIDEWWDAYIPEFETVYKDFSLIKEDNLLLGGIAARKMIYTGKLGETEYKFQQIAAIKENVVYVLTYTSTSEAFDDHTEDMEKIVEYFEFT